ncbi:hypothetical protein SEA_GENGAR_72 [Mycobacterium phage Gengar]|uniref:Uncharacterized protein n=1 Tax=Mycobacterium phage Gengar TaxID=1891963 RepID=A0A1C9EGW2_9CAUD|nr:hypothetical protein SEA_GENGAR_72 [Mycobacterium phage Gengar]AON96727.1 hypothetical protein SEA_GENGAR_72 [Mycobacterium phage Gengar]
MVRAMTAPSELHRVIVNIQIDVDLHQYAADYNLVGQRSARDDLKQVVVDIVRRHLQRMGIHPDNVTRQR